MRIVFLFIITFMAGCIQYERLSEPNKINSLMNTADEYVGMNEMENRSELRSFMDLDPVNYEWCAAFVNAVIKLNGIPGSDSVSDYPLTARSFLKWGEKVDVPRKGDIVVFPRGNEGWQGHVGFYVTSYIEEETEYYVILGGNQDDEVSYDDFKAKSAISIRRWPGLHEN